MSPTAKPRVLLLTQWFDPEPTFKGLVFARELVRQGFDVEVVTGFPNYPAPDADGYPNRVDVSRRIRLVFGATPDYYDTYAPFMDGEIVPAIKNADGVMVANEKYKNVPGAVLHEGNLPNKGPRAANQGVHSGDDVILTAIGPGAQEIHGQMENTELFRVMADALSLAPARAGKK